MKSRLRHWLLSIALGLCAMTAQAAEVKFSVSQALPDSTFFITAASEGPSNNICKRFPSTEPGSHRDVCQRIATGRAQMEVNRLVLHLADSSQSIGQGAKSSEMSFRIVRFMGNEGQQPILKTVFQGQGRLPAEMMPGEHLIIDFPEVTLEPSAIYGLEIGFAEPAEHRYINISTTGRHIYPNGRIYFHTNEPNAQILSYSLRRGNLVFQLGVR